MFGDVFMDFRNLSQMSILHLMNELAKHEQATKNNKAAPQDIEHLENLLHRYSKSMKLVMVVDTSLRYLHVSYRCS